ncbi:MAG: hypothetical protein AAF922_05985 [Pseudomonadota bacterium]
MEKLFQSLVETNIPTLLTISGIALLFLALAGRFGAYIEIREERQKFTLILGALLLIAGIGLHVFPAVVEGGPQPPSAGNPGTPSPGVTRADTVNWIQAGSFQTPGRADDFAQMLSNRLNRDSSVPDLEVQVLKGSVTGCVFDRVVVIPNDPENRDQLEDDFFRVRAIVEDALLREREAVLNSQSACQ